MLCQRSSNCTELVTNKANEIDEEFGENTCKTISRNSISQDYPFSTLCLSISICLVQMVIQINEKRK